MKELRAALIRALGEANDESDRARELAGMPFAGQRERDALQEARGVQRGLLRAVELLDAAEVGSGAVKDTAS